MDDKDRVDFILEELKDMPEFKKVMKDLAKS